MSEQVSVVREKALRNLAKRWLVAAHELRARQFKCPAPNKSGEWRRKCRDGAETLSLHAEQLLEILDK